ncbi:hypothetical protein I6F34_00980 [Bradyrhizobium sp. BRP05]|nr:hypothetical protein [Bradyrhizobium sp. BRP05]
MQGAKGFRAREAAANYKRRDRRLVSEEVRAIRAANLSGVSFHGEIDEEAVKAAAEAAEKAAAEAAEKEAAEKEAAEANEQTGEDEGEQAADEAGEAEQAEQTADAAPNKPAKTKKKK